MMTFIDESGDAGFKPGSSLYFVLTLVAVDEEQIAKLDTHIQQLKQTNHIFPEYKFSKTSEHHKEIFFSSLMYANFQVYSIVVKKSLVYSNELRNNSKKFYNFFLKQLLQMAHLQVHTKIRIDKSSSKIFQREAKTYIRKQLENLQLDIKFLDSKSANLIQLADMISGAICRSYAQPAKPQWIHKIKDKVHPIEVFG